jgi:hypothetical protein
MDHFILKYPKLSEQREQVEREFCEKIQRHENQLLPDCEDMDH